jgi:hypothetical protein
MNLHEVFEKHVSIWHERTHYPYQDLITRSILEGIEASLRGEAVTIPIEVPRQSGKTTSIVDIAEFLLVAYRHYFGKPIAIGIFAPQREQATTDFDRLKTQYAEIAPLGFTTKAGLDADTKMPEKWNSKTIRVYNNGRFCGEVYIFPISKTSNPESKSLGLIIIEEAQQVDDTKMKSSVFPMGASTNAPRIMVGTAGTRLCEFKRQLDTNPRAIKIKLEQVFADRRRVYEQTKDPFHLRYEQFVTNEIKEYGADSDYIKTQYGGVWVIGAGQFCTVEQLETLIGEGQQLIRSSTQPAYVGIDTAKSPDQTIVTVLVDDEKDPRKSKLAGWLSLKGENYEDQFEAIADWLNPKYEEYEEKGKKKERLIAGFPEIRGIALDATGQGDFMPDKFERHTGYNIIRVPFTLQSKDTIYKNLLQVIQNGLTSIPDVRSDRDWIGWLTECVNLVKEWKGRYLSVHHPDDPNAHDDYPDSWALAEYAKTQLVSSEPTIRVL